MPEDFGSDFMTISDEDGTEYELEILTTVEYNGCQYLAAIPASDDPEEKEDFDILILKSVMEDDEPLLEAVTDEAELEAVNMLIMDQLYQDEQ